MKSLNSNYPPIPLSFEDHDQTTIHASRGSSADVVESPASSRAGLHPHEFEHDARGAPPRERRARLGDLDAGQYDDDLAGHFDDVAPKHDHVATEYDDPHDEQAIRHRDKLDRQADRAHAQRERRERRTRRSGQLRASRGRHPTAGPRRLGTLDDITQSRSTQLRDLDERSSRLDRAAHQPAMPASDRLSHDRGVAHVATNSSALKRFSSGPLHGIALIIYFFLLPYVVVSRWDLTRHQSHGALVRTLLVALGVFWLAFLIQLVTNIVRLRRGVRLNANGSAWLAGLMVAALPFLISPAASSATPRTTPTVSANVATSRWLKDTPTRRVDHPRPAKGESAALAGGLPLALVAKRRFDQLHQQANEPDEEDIDDDVDLLRGHDPDLLAQVRSLIGDQNSGVILVPPDVESLAPSSSTDAIVVRVLSHDDQGTVITFAREGGHLAVDAGARFDEIEASCVALHRGRLVFESTVSELLRSLATRNLRNATVVYLGPAHEIDDELRACCVTLERAGDPLADTPYRFVPTPADPPAAPITTHGDVLVQLLRVDPQITGLAEAFTPTLRRRCIEMVAYLALHRGEPVTGERLRTRVLSHASVDASSRTLANTASAVRRSLGADEAGSRLHPVTSLGLYTTHGLTSDVEHFHALVKAARGATSSEAAPLAREALQLVHGEPLASALRGFEWFLVEGSFAQLQRDGEWAALLVHHEAMLDEQYELAFWALRQGLLVDPYSDALTDALSRVPRLRQFGGDRTGRAKDQAVGAGDAVAVGWSFNRLGDQIVQ